MNHELKCDPQPFEEMASGNKTFELRREDDRRFEVGDTLMLRETRYTSAGMRAGWPLQYTGRTMTKVVTHILRGPDYGLPDGLAILSCR